MVLSGSLRVDKNDIDNGGNGKKCFFKPVILRESMFQYLTVNSTKIFFE